MLLTVLKYPNPILKKKAEPIDKVTDEYKKLMDDMAETMYASQGVGLAAPQIGVSKRIFVIDIDRKNLIQMANPKIIKAEGVLEWEEGCLSIPEFTVKTKRKARITVLGLDRNNKQIEIEAEGLLSVAFQHETDHLDGKLLIDKISGLKREMYLKKIRKTSVL